MTDIKELLIKSEFPLSAKYDPDWILDNQMGPNALWLAEWLLQEHRYCFSIVFIVFWWDKWKEEEIENGKQSNLQRRRN